MIVSSNVFDVTRSLQVSAPPEPAPRRATSVLVVEDDPDQQWRLARMLTVNGNRVVGTSSGDGALALIAEWPVDLVLIDDTLPGMHAVELARRIRDTYPRIAVALMTDGDPLACAPDARRLGAFACFSKPLAPEAIDGLLRLRPTSTDA